MKPNPSEIIALRHGFFVHVGALLILWHLEEKGCTIRLLAGQFAFEPPKGMKALTGRQRDLIAKYKTDLARVVRYVEKEQYTG